MNSFWFLKIFVYIRYALEIRLEIVFSTRFWGISYRMILPYGTFFTKKERKVEEF